VSPTWTHLVTALTGLLIGVVVAAVPLCRQRRALRDARYAALHDDITGLPNRRAVQAALGVALARGRACGLVLIDLDDFKTINDTHGHEAGNDVLAAVADRLTRLPTSVQVAGRLSGDEFVLLVRGDRDSIADIARHTWQIIATTPVTLTGHHITVRASVGYATARHGMTARELLHHADQAMYEAKRSSSGVAGYAATLASPAPPGRRYRDLPRW
jgi:diguanylate cyclase (GGDEF)-like protein